MPKEKAKEKVREKAREEKSKAILRVENLSKFFSLPARDNKKTESFLILEDINLEVFPGETVAILGKSGSGKSTLLSLIAGLDVPGKGRIFINDHPINEFNEKELTRFRAEHLSIVFQQFQLIHHLSVIDNITLPLYLTDQFNSNAKNRALELLEEIDLRDRASFFPKELSGGEQQRVAIARSLIIEPKLILADEPTGNLDVKTGNKVIQKFFSLVEEKKKTLILVTHDLSIAKKCAKVYEIKDKKLALIKKDSPKKKSLPKKEPLKKRTLKK